MALGDIDPHFAWQAWHLRHWAGSGDALGSRLALWSPSPFAWQAWRLVTSAFVLCGRRGLGDIDPHFAWQAWHLRHWAVSGGALGSRLVPWSPPPFAWQAWHLVTSAFVLRGRRALGDIDRHFAWQAWHLRHWAGSGDALGSRLAPWSPPPFAWQAWHLVTSAFVLRGRRGTC